MRLKSFLNEKFLRSEYKFGFELEAITKDYQHAISFISKYFKGDVKTDKSIKNYEKNETPFEFASSVYSFTPQNINNFIKLIEQLPKNNIRTNESCGFHIHLSYPFLDIVNTRWVIMNLAMDSKTQNLIKKFKEVDFFNEQYADTRFLEDLKEALKDEDYDRMSDILDNSKYRNLRIHPIGTLEWRGPRGDWLNSGSVKTIKEFVKVLLYLVNWINDVLDSKILYGTNITKNELIDNLNNFGIYLTFDKQKTLLSMIDYDAQDKSILSDIVKSNKWILDCTFNNGILKLKNNLLIMSNATWENGLWKNGIWENGIWYNGVWENGKWLNGEWYGGEWQNGIWYNGYWDVGKWIDGVWKNGEWGVGEIYSKKFKTFIKSTGINPKEFYELEKKYNNVKDLERKVI